jgi:hypothetical protein
VRIHVHACFFTATGGMSRIEIRDVQCPFLYKRLGAARLPLPACFSNFADRKRLIESVVPWVDVPHETALKVILSGDVRQPRQFIRFGGKFSCQKHRSDPSTNQQQNKTYACASQDEPYTRARDSVSARQMSRYRHCCGSIGLPFNCGQGINPCRASSRIRRTQL